MSIAYEFSKIREGFSKVKSDLIFLGQRLAENYDEFKTHHETLAKKIDDLSDELKDQIKVLKEKATTQLHKIDSKELLNIKSEIKELKTELSNVQASHNKIFMLIEDVKKARENSSKTSKPQKEDKNIKDNQKDIKKIKDQLHNSELEIFLLKERMLEKDEEIKKIKDLNKHMFSIIDDLSKIELELLNVKK